jgi:hypothetical protein
VTGTLAPGATATGGIITSLGSGSFVGTATSNAFTNTNSFSSTTTMTGSLLSQSAATFTPASAATSPATIQGAASQSAYLLPFKDSSGTLLGGFDDDGVYRGPANFGEWTSPPPPPVSPPPPPPTPPTVTLAEAVIYDEELLVYFSEAVTGASGAAGFALTADGGPGPSVNYVSGNGTALLVFSARFDVTPMAVTLAYTPGSIVAVSDSDALASFSGFTVDVLT